MRQASKNLSYLSNSNPYSRLLIATQVSTLNLSTQIKGSVNFSLVTHLSVYSEQFCICNLPFTCWSQS